MVLGAETRGTLLLASQNYEKLKARGHTDSGFPWRVEQAIKSGLINIDDDLAKCLIDERRSWLVKEMSKGRHRKKQKRRQQNQTAPPP
jgi:hypothetical protein